MMAVECDGGPGAMEGLGWLTRQQAAARLRISERHLDRLIVMGRIQKQQARPYATVWISAESCDQYLWIQSS